MKITAEKFDETVQRFVAEYVVPNAKHKSTLFRLGVASGFGKLKLDKEKLEGLAELGIVGDDGQLDVDLMRKAVDAGLSLAGELYLKKLGLTFYKADLDAFFRLIETGKV